MPKNIVIICSDVYSLVSISDSFMYWSSKVWCWWDWFQPIKKFSSHMGKLRSYGFGNASKMGKVFRIWGRETSSNMQVREEKFWTFFFFKLESMTWYVVYFMNLCVANYLLNKILVWCRPKDGNLYIFIGQGDSVLFYW